MQIRSSPCLDPVGQPPDGFGNITEPRLLARVGPVRQMRTKDDRRREPVRLETLDVAETGSSGRVFGVAEIRRARTGQDPGGFCRIIEEDRYRAERSCLQEPEGLGAAGLPWASTRDAGRAICLRFKYTG